MKVGRRGSSALRIEWAIIYDEKTGVGWGTAQSNSQLQWDVKYSLLLLGETSKSKGKG